MIKNFLKKCDFIFFILFIVIFLQPILFSFRTVYLEESYLQFASYSDLNLMYLSNDFKLPQWAFHFGGGYPFFAHPENMILSPLFWLFLFPFGTAVGLKLYILFAYFCGVFGFYFLCVNIFKLERFFSFLGAILFIISNFIVYRINTGGVMDVLWFLFPVSLCLFFYARKNLIYSIILGGVLTFIFFSGFGLLLAPFMLALYIFSFFDCFPRDDSYWSVLKKNVKISALSFISFIFFSGIKLLPMLELLIRNDRSFNNYFDAAANAMTLETFFSALLLRGPFAAGGCISGFRNGLGIGVVCYVGWILLIIVCFGAVRYFKVNYKIIFFMLFFMALSFANNFPLDLFYFLWHLPIFKSMHEVAVNFVFPVYFGFCLLAVKTVHFLSTTRSKRLLLSFLVCLGIYSIIYTNSLYLSVISANMIDDLDCEGEHAFYSIKKFNEKSDWAWSENEDLLEDEIEECLQYFLLKNNIGLLNWYGNIDLPVNVQPKYFINVSDVNISDKTVSLDYGKLIPNPNYSGEVYYRKAHNYVNSVEYGTNRITINVVQSDNDILIINQNYDDDWHSSFGKIYNADGLLAVKIDKKYKGSLVLSYRPFAFCLGSVLSGIGVMIILFMRKTYKKRLVTDI